MTRMGKTSLAVRIAEAFAKKRRVVVLDQTGEYIGKRKLPVYDKDGSWSTVGLSVLEPRPGVDVILPKFADEFFKKVTAGAVEEYKKGDPSPRVIVIDEAHQFVPEPAGIGFGSAGRDEAIHFGLLMMQVRKYGIMIVLISQRTAVVAKSALSQCENLIVFKSVDQTGLDYLEAVAGEGIRGLLPQLQQGEAVVFGPAISADGPVAISVNFT
jgi:DNA helicase HerA-like ATPase